MQISNNYSASYMASVNKGRQNIADNEKRSFSDVAVMKTKEADNREVQKKSSAILDSIGSRTPEEVKQAWMEAAKEVSANGLGMKKDGILSHISQMMVQRCNKMLRGEADSQDILGNTVESAIQATKQALYDLEHPRAYVPKSIEVQQAQIKEQEFYTAFLEKLENI